MVEKAEDVADGADAVLLLTDWFDFKSLPWLAMKKRMLSPLLFDGRNFFNPEEMRSFGFTYTSIGR
jgi:UDPglucose 6-dehydrogenase